MMDNEQKQLSPQELIELDKIVAIVRNTPSLPKEVREQLDDYQVCIAVMAKSLLNKQLSKALEELKAKHEQLSGKTQDL